MPLRFAPEYPSFPDELVDDLLKGEVVVLCGAGVSAHALDDFHKLTVQVFDTLRMRPTSGEQHALDNEHRYEEVLGSLAGRISVPDKVSRAVSDRLQMRPDIDLSNHLTLLRISRDKENQPVIVTTNFDLLFEHALRNSQNEEESESFAGQDLPSPGSANFRGIIHLHGRISDDDLGLKETPLILTSSNYGDAYMRSGWASRFLFDLARCRTLLLVGYSAEDAPVRYFLNVLEADRRRFKDLRQVYALASYETHADEVEKQWNLLGVRPIPFRKKIRGQASYAALWRSLEELAKLAERPKKVRVDRVTSLFSKPFVNCAEYELEFVSWILTGRNDLWDEVISCITDPEWFNYIHENELWSPELRERILAFWISEDFLCPQRLDVAIYWSDKFGHKLLECVRERLGRSRELPKDWHRIWRLFCLQDLSKSDLADPRFREVCNVIEAGTAFDQDLEYALTIIAPRLKLRGSLTLGKAGGVCKSPKLHEVCWPELRSIETGTAKSVVAALLSQEKYYLRILELANLELRKAMEVLRDIGGVSTTFDSTDRQLPSIEPHSQNEHTEGIYLLVSLIVEIYPFVESNYPRQALTLARDWLETPGHIGHRLFFHVSRKSNAINVNEAFRTLLASSKHVFWSCKREVALLIRDLAGVASQEVIEQLSGRILLEGALRFEDVELGPEEPDWRPRMRDSSIWLYLSMLEDSKRLSKSARRKLNNIKENNKDLQRSFAERDLFESYSSGVRTVIGHTDPILDANIEDQVKVANELLQSSVLEDQLGWSEYCQADPAGASTALISSGLTANSIELWEQFLYVISFAGQEITDSNIEVVQNALSYLRTLPDDELRDLAQALAYVLYYRWEQISDHHNWWWKIWRQLEEGEIGDSKDLLDTAINSGAGRLASVAIEFHSKACQASQSLEPYEAMLKDILTNEGSKRNLARAIMVQKTAYLLSNCEFDIERQLRELLTCPQNDCFRSVFICFGDTNLDIFKKFKDIVLRSVSECTEDIGTYAARNAAAQILRPALDVAKLKAVGDSNRDWEVSDLDLAEAFRQTSFPVRISALEVLHQWALRYSNGPDVFIKDEVHPLMKFVWPNDIDLVDERMTREFVRLLCLAGQNFEDVVDDFVCFIAPFKKSRVFIHSIDSSLLPDNAPEKTLGLLWHLLKYRPVGEVQGISTILDRMLKAKPNLEIDRRFQRLEELALRL